MKQANDYHTSTFKRATLAAIGLGFMLGCSSCKTMGLLSKNDEEENEQLSLLNEPLKKKKRPSLFNRAKNNNSFIDEDVTTTRRERIAAQNRANFGTTESAADPIPSLLDPKPTAFKPIATENALTPDPVRIDARPMPRPAPVETNLELPSENNGFNTPRITPQPDPVEPVRPTGVDKDGYRLLQPKLPGAETIEPPAE